MTFLNKTILGINDTHDASACIVRDGKILCAIAEERIQRVKSAGGYPKGAIDACLQFAKLSLDDIDYVALAGTRAVPVNMLGTLATFTLEDFIKIQEKVRYPQFNGGKALTLAELFPDYTPKNEVYYSLQQLPLKETRELSELDREEIDHYRLNFISTMTGKAPSQIYLIDHHTCHAYYAYYASSFRGVPATVLTMDAGGDGIYQSVSLFDARGEYKRLHADHECIIGLAYTMTTLLLRMRPYEHEFKVMGLAPYAKEYTKKNAREAFMRLVELKGVCFERNPATRDLYHYLSNALSRERFDGIAGGVQDWVEYYLCEWVRNAIQLTGSKNVAFSGGVSLNVKANQRIAQLQEAGEVFIPPGGGDESLAIGAAWRLLDQLNPAGDHRLKIEAMHDAYLGDELLPRDIEEFEADSFVRERYSHIDGDPNALAAEALSRNEIVALCRGRMEFGPRALGHRSLIANPASRDSVFKMNEAIKGRDFWMPFAPSLIAEFASEYISAPGKANLSFMTFTSDSLPSARTDLVAALHPYDQTVRAQVVTDTGAPDFHNLLGRFRSLTGLPGVLNTSLNIHGKPIIRKPIEIVSELLRAPNVDLKFIVVGDRFYRRNDN